MKLDRLAGNSALKRQLSAQAGGRGLSHAYLISGPAGSGKAALAELLSAAMVCTGAGEKPCGKCPGCKKVLAGVHPDVIHVDIPQGKREILVEQTRRIRSDAYIRPNEAQRKVYVIHNAQAMNPSAQNSILKLLEEGPAYAAFLLLTENPGSLLPTIRSRCEGLNLTPPDQAPPAEDDPARNAALELLDLLSRGDELELAAWAVSLEKWDREALVRFLEEGVALLREAMAPQPSSPPQVLSAARSPQKKLLSAAELLERLRSHAEFYVGGGHLCGALCAGLSSL